MGVFSGKCLAGGFIRLEDMQGARPGSRPQGPDSKCTAETIEEGQICTRRVHFKRGSSSAIYREQWLVRTTGHEFLVEARAGQRMSITISSVENNVIYTVDAPDGKTQLMNGKKNWSGVLPMSGTYRIGVGGERGNATYTLRISVR